VKKRTRVAVLSALLVIAMGAIAYGYWTQGGIGSGSATAGTTQAITVNQTGSPTGLYPGGTPTALSGTFTNPNAHHVKISSVTAVVRAFSVPGTGGNPACTQADFVIGGTTGVPLIDVPAGTGVGAWSGLTVQLQDLSTNQDACKNVPITIDYTANP
jgi:hypothetical protein